MAIEEENGKQGANGTRAAVTTSEIAEDNNEAQGEIEHETSAEREAREKREEQERQFRAKKRKLIPPFVMLLAGAITSITMRLLHYDTKSMLIILLLVLLGFYIAGCFIKYMLDKFEAQIEEASMDEGEVIEKELVEDGMSGTKSVSEGKG